jgi:hypothetical protein
VYGLVTIGSGQGPMMGSLENNNGPSGSINVGK